MVTAGMLFLLYIFVQHHSGIDGCDVWGCKVVTGIFIGHDYLVDIVHRIDGDIFRFFPMESRNWDKVSNVF